MRAIVALIVTLAASLPSSCDLAQQPFSCSDQGGSRGANPGLVFDSFTAVRDSQGYYHC